MTPTAEWYEADADDSDRSVTNDVTTNAHETTRAATETGETGARVHGDADLLRKRTAALNRTSAENERLRAEVERMRGWLSISEAAVKSLAAEADKRDVEAPGEVERHQQTYRRLEQLAESGRIRAELAEERMAGALTERDAAEAKLRDVEAERDRQVEVLADAIEVADSLIDYSHTLGDEGECTYDGVPADECGVRLIRERLARSQAPQAPVERSWSMVGGSMEFSREEWGVIIDALIQHRGHADLRKAANSESTSDVRSAMCADLIGRINAAASVRPATADDEEFCPDCRAGLLSTEHHQECGQP